MGAQVHAGWPLVAWLWSTAQCVLWSLPSALPETLTFRCRGTSLRLPSSEDCTFETDFKGETDFQMMKAGMEMLRTIYHLRREPVTDLF